MGGCSLLFIPLLCFILTQHCIIKISLYLLVFHTSRNILSRLAAFWLFFFSTISNSIFFSTISNSVFFSTISNSINCPSLISSWLIVMLMFIRIFWRISKQILEMFFPFLKSFLVGSFTLKVLFFQFISFTVSHAKIKVTDILNLYVVFMTKSFLHQKCNYQIKLKKE